MMLYSIEESFPLQALVVGVIPCKKLHIAWDFHAADSLNCRSCYYVVFSLELASPQHRIYNNKSSKQASPLVIFLVFRCNTLAQFE